MSNQSDAAGRFVGKLNEVTITPRDAVIRAQRARQQAEARAVKAQIEQDADAGAPDTGALDEGSTEQAS